MELKGYVKFVNRNRKKQRTYEDSNFEYYYDLIVQHGIFTIKEINYKKKLRLLLICSVLFFVASIIIFLFPNSIIVTSLCGESHLNHIVMASTMLYVSLLTIVFSIYHALSIKYERKNERKLEIHKQKGTYKILYFVMLLINTPWIIIICFVIRILKKVNLYNIRELLPGIAVIYCYVILAWGILSSCSISILKLVNDRYNIVCAYFDEGSWLCIIGIFIYFLLIKLANKVFKIFVGFTINEDKKIEEEFHRLNSYIFIFLSSILRILHFEGSEKELVEIFFTVSVVVSLLKKPK